MKITSSLALVALAALLPAFARADGPPPDVDGFLAAHPEIAQAMVWEIEPAPVPTVTPTVTATPKPSPTVTEKPQPTSTLVAYLPRPTATPGIIRFPGGIAPSPTATAVLIRNPGLVVSIATPTKTPPAVTPTPTPVATVTPGSPVAAAWPQWPESRKQKLRDNVAHYAAWLADGMPLYEAWAQGGFQAEPDGFAAHFDPEADQDPTPAVYPPTNLQWNFPNGAKRDVYPSTQAFDLYVKNVAFLLALEMGNHVPWSFLGLDAASLAQLLDGRTTFAYVPAGQTQWGSIKSAGHLLTVGVVPGPPQMVFSYLVRNALLSTSRLDTIQLALEWSKPFVHTWGGTIASGASLSWVLFQYDGRPPVTRMMNGTFMTEAVGPIFFPDRRHFVGGCGGYSAFIREFLRPVGIPVETVTPDHHQPHFMSEGRYLSHGDDPYSLSPDTPSDDLLIDQAQYEAWFVNDPNPSHNTGRRADELEIEYLGLKTLRWRCTDYFQIQNGVISADHAQSHLYTSCFKTTHTLAELEALDLWDRADAKIASMPGGCASVPYF